MGRVINLVDTSGLCPYDAQGNPDFGSQGSPEWQCWNYAWSVLSTQPQGFAADEQELVALLHNELGITIGSPNNWDRDSLTTVIAGAGAIAMMFARENATLPGLDGIQTLKEVYRNTTITYDRPGLVQVWCGFACAPDGNNIYLTDAWRNTNLDWAITTVIHELGHIFDYRTGGGYLCPPHNGGWVCPGASGLHMQETGGCYPNMVGPGAFGPGGSPVALALCYNDPFWCGYDVGGFPPRPYAGINHIEDFAVTWENWVKDPSLIIDPHRRQVMSDAIAGLVRYAALNEGWTPPPMGR